MLKPILLVEDSVADRELIALALERCRIANPLVIVHDGEEALDYLFRQGAWAERKDDTPAICVAGQKAAEN